tara:strand:+ start:485 stop:634 length:150 start_codon:yes stop_codon:yes gene_type:complete
MKALESENSVQRFGGPAMSPNGQTDSTNPTNPGQFNQGMGGRGQYSQFD